jgi:cytochrome c
MVRKLLQCLGMGVLVAAYALPGQAAPLLGDAADRGQGLYENHCTVCHDASVHTRDARRVHNRGELQLYVSTWSYHAQLDWSREEITDVVDYLDRSYYRFTEQP